MIPEIQELKDKNTRYSSFSAFRTAIEALGPEFEVIRDSTTHDKDPSGEDYVDIENPYSGYDSVETLKRTGYVRITCRRGNRDTSDYNHSSNGYYIGNIISGGYALKSKPTGTTTVPVGQWFEAFSMGSWPYEIGPSTEPNISIKLILADANHRTECIKLYITKKAAGSDDLEPVIESSSPGNPVSTKPDSTASNNPVIPDTGPAIGPIRTSHELGDDGILYPATRVCNRAGCSCARALPDGSQGSTLPNRAPYISCFSGGDRDNDGSSEKGELFLYKESDVPEGTVYGLLAVGEVAHIPYVIKIKLVELEGIGVSKIWSLDLATPIVNWVDNKSVISNPE